MEILIISGLSGGGKSRAASFLEDIGFYIVDNMPAGMILKFAEFCAAGSGRYSRVALVYDVRTADSFDEFLEVLATLRQREYNCKLLYLWADVGAIINRYKETRRLHPLQERAGSLEEAVRQEIQLMSPVRAQADMVIDSTNYSTARLRGELVRLFGGLTGAGELMVSLVSFGFKHGLPLEADLVFDVRFMPNPFYIDALRAKTGLDAEVRDYVLSFRETEQFLEKLRELLRFVLPLYREEGKTVLVVAIGCTGGHHRSVAVTHALAEYISSLGYQVTENHRDMTRS
ncbi:MAG: RNase adapter RapZ [Oscillospiraceae bacterium]|nr:RNase adapter RapZ [Oscillospiraceae bacterium]